jgi:hypothetical protein
VPAEAIAQAKIIAKNRSAIFKLNKCLEFMDMDTIISTPYCYEIQEDLYKFCFD